MWTWSMASIWIMAFPGDCVPRFSIVSDAPGAATSQRHVAVLLRRVGVALVLEHLQRIDQPRARGARLDHVVDVAAGGGDIGIGKLRSVVVHQLVAHGLWIGGPVDLVFE